MTSYPNTVKIDRHGSAATRVILAEDDHDLRLGLAEYLRLSAFAVTDVASGLAFYKALRTDDFDIAILDVNLPDTTGFELARDVSAERRMGIILLTARTGRDDRKRGYAEGADLFLTKPVDGEELVLAIRNLARRLRAEGQEPGASEEPVAPPAPVRAAPAWRLELAHRRLVSPEGRVVRLSGRETMLMEHLAQSQGMTASRASLTALLGYDGFGTESRSLDAALSRMRRKGYDCGVQLPLLAVHAVGIRFAAPIEVA